MSHSHLPCGTCGYRPFDHRTPSQAATDLANHSCTYRLQLAAEGALRGGRSTRPSQEPRNVKRYRVSYDRGHRILVAATPAAWQMQALAGIGWSPRLLEPHTGMGFEELRTIRGGWRARIHVEKAEAIATAYRRLRFTPGPIAQTATQARKAGWPTVDDLEYGTELLVDQVDDVAVERALAGDTTVTLNRHEFQEAVRRGHNAAIPHKEITRRLATTHNRVLRNMRVLRAQDLVAC